MTPVEVAVAGELEKRTSFSVSARTAARATVPSAWAVATDNPKAAIMPSKVLATIPLRLIVSSCDSTGLLFRHALPPKAARIRHKSACAKVDKRPIGAETQGKIVRRQNGYVPRRV